jgi:hypothetical protein
MDVPVSSLGHLFTGADVFGNACRATRTSLLIMQHNNVAEHDAASSPCRSIAVARNQKTSTTLLKNQN